MYRAKWLLPGLALICLGGAAAVYVLGQYAYYTWPAVPLMAAVVGGAYWMAHRVKT